MPCRAKCGTSLLPEVLAAGQLLCLDARARGVTCKGKSTSHPLLCFDAVKLWPPQMDVWGSTGFFKQNRKVICGARTIRR